MAGQVIDYVRVASKFVGLFFFVLYLLAKERERKMELLLLATFCIAA
ncbi:hypothetical protein Psch_03521 [Pelotomaculum schinkii]|uniref:Uncharacterized protein n=1 Tax=Pelotomaculum schinkii TaxID=78350 RepID=A0A4Y7R7Q6_9FIRM|nr:hypothetical protein [Pelotomaculum schinkii]TEB04759.1 hypothetical protein Psch_03521 [Pelotomaculum schinkii]